ncbi:CASP-like protein 1D1 [Hirschfeldia incana]|nr:CASP-like protein 1D1 [Hirschfeldia incana]
MIMKASSHQRILILLVTLCIVLNNPISLFLFKCRYFVVALSVACFYSILSTLATVSAFKKPSSCSAILLLNLAIMDAVMVGIVASATGASGGVAYIGLKGNKNVNWDKICNRYDTFCRHVGGAIAVSLVASIILLLLSIISVLSLYKRIR